MVVSSRQKVSYVLGSCLDQLCPPTLTGLLDRCASKLSSPLDFDAMCESSVWVSMARDLGVYPIFSAAQWKSRKSSELFPAPLPMEPSAFLELCSAHSDSLLRQSNSLVASCHRHLDALNSGEGLDAVQSLTPTSQRRSQRTQSKSLSTPHRATLESTASVCRALTHPKWLSGLSAAIDGSPHLGLVVLCSWATVRALSESRYCTSLSLSGSIQQRFAQLFDAPTFPALQSSLEPLSSEELSTSGSSASFLTDFINHLSGQLGALRKQVDHLQSAILSTTASIDSTAINQHFNMKLSAAPAEIPCSSFNWSQHSLHSLLTRIQTNPEPFSLEPVPLQPLPVMSLPATTTMPHVIEIVPHLRPYQSLSTLGLSQYQFQLYFITHYIFALSDWGNQIIESVRIDSFRVFSHAWLMQFAHSVC